MIELNKDNYDAEVLEFQGIVMVDYWSPKCDPCMALMPDVENMAEEFAGKVKVGKVNALENRRLCIAQKVMGLPTFLFYVNGEKVAELNAETVSVETIRAKLEELVA